MGKWTVGAIGAHHIWTPITVVGNTGGNSNSPPATITLPAATKAGDFVIVGLSGGTYSSDPAKTGLAGCPDGRFQTIYYNNSNVWTRPGGVWISQSITDITTPISITLRGNSGSPTGQFATWNCIVLRGEEVTDWPEPGQTGVPYPLRWDGQQASKSETAGGTGQIPGLPLLTGVGAIATVITSGGIGGAYGFGWEEAPIYSQVAEAGNYTAVSFAKTAETQVPTQPSVMNDPDNSWMAVVFGLNVLVPPPP